MNKIALALILVLALTVLACDIPSENNRIKPDTERFTATVQLVVNGGSILVRHQAHVMVKFYGVTVPGYGQPGAPEATAALKRLQGQTLTLQEMGIDRYGRMVALVKSEGQSVNLELVKLGLARYDSEICKEQPICGEIEKAEAEARKARRGLWTEESAVPTECYIALEVVFVALAVAVGFIMMAALDFPLFSLLTHMPLTSTLIQKAKTKFLIDKNFCEVFKARAAVGALYALAVLLVAKYHNKKIRFDSKFGDEIDPFALGITVACFILMVIVSIIIMCEKRWGFDAKKMIRDWTGVLWRKFLKTCYSDVTGIFIYLFGACCIFLLDALWVGSDKCYLLFETWVFLAAPIVFNMYYYKMNQESSED